MKLRLKINAVIIAATLCTFAGSAMAFDLFDKIKSDFAAINAKGEQDKAKINDSEQTGGGQSSVDSPQIMGILKIEASKIVLTHWENCSVDYFQKEENQWVLGPFQRAEYNMAAPGADRIAGEMARCALKDPANLAQWSNQVGQMLAFSAISWKNAGVGGTPQVASTAGRAITLLSFAKQNNINGASQTLDKMKESGFVISEDKASAKQPRGKIVLAASAAEVVEKFQGNRLAFNKNYTGKILQVTGSVRNVSDRPGNPPGADVIVSGIVRQNPDNAQNSDNISCEITDAKMVSVAADLEPKKTITASGLYDPKLRSYGLFESQVVLHDCQIR